MYKVRRRLHFSVSLKRSATFKKEKFIKINLIITIKVLFISNNKVAGILYSVFHFFLEGLFLLFDPRTLSYFVFCLWYAANFIVDDLCLLLLF
jgi:hypothetical protein